MKNIFSTLIILILSIITLSAQNKADVILDDFALTMQSYETIQADFTYKMENKKENIDEGYKGSIYLKGDMYRLEIAGQIIQSDGITIWTYIPDAEEVQINTVDESDDSFNPTHLFSSYSEDYQAKFDKQYSVGPKIINVINLKPNDSSLGFSDAKIELDSKSKMLIQFIIYDDNNNAYSYIVDKFFTNKNLENSFFQFNEADYPDVEVIDMR